MTVNAKLYRPPHITQHGIDTTLDECAFCATLVALGCATSGEVLMTPKGREMGKAQLHAFVRRLRRKIKDTAGGITISQRKEICTALGFPEPADVDLTVGVMLDRLKAKTHVFTGSGNPGNIKAASAMKRCDCSHEWAFIEARGGPKVADSDILVYDPLRNAGPRRRGEWVPAVHVRQMLFKDGDRQATFLLQYPRGGWTREALALARRQKAIRTLREGIAERDRTIERVREARDEAKKGLADEKVVSAGLREALEACEAGGGTEPDDIRNDIIDELIATLEDKRP